MKIYLKKLLKDRFGEITNRKQALATLRNLKQKTDESVQMFGERVIQVSEDVYTTQRKNENTNDLIEQQLIDIFCKGLTFDYLKMKLIREDPATLDAAVKIAKREQNIRDQISLTLDKSQNILRLNTEKDDRDIQPMEVDHLRNKLCKTCLRKGHSTQNCPYNVDVNAADKSDSDDSNSDVDILPISKNKHVKFKDNKKHKQNFASKPSL